jgi:hypothetical protein
VDYRTAWINAVAPEDKRLLLDVIRSCRDNLTRLLDENNNAKREANLAPISTDHVFVLGDDSSGESEPNSLERKQFLLVRIH